MPGRRTRPSYSIVTPAPSASWPGEDPAIRRLQVITGSSPVMTIARRSLLRRRRHRNHAQRAEIEFEHRLFFLALLPVALAQAHHLAQDLRVEAMPLGLAIDFLDVVRERPFLVLQPLDSLDQALELPLGE